MARTLSVNVPHALGRADARRRVAEGFSNVRQQLTGGMWQLVSFQEHWEGDRLHFAGGGLGQSIRGRLDVGDDAVQIEIELPLLLSAIADRVAGELRTATGALLEDRRSPRAE
ncbi:MAG: polyhydroxyalkanoic acid system family protein [Planctomycetaceae bacterium]|nr:polyhydroxyalkanoic acid system family protein [Planctomycetaceae bacterium]